MSSKARTLRDESKIVFNFCHNFPTVQGQIEGTRMESLATVEFGLPHHRDVPVGVFIFEVLLITQTQHTHTLLI